MEKIIRWILTVSSSSDELFNGAKYKLFVFSRYIRTTLFLLSGKYDYEIGDN